MSLEEDAKNADKCGMTYGYYMPVKGKIKVPENFKSYNDKQEEKKMAMGIPITEDQKENIIALHEKGLTTSKIAKRTGLSESSVRRTVRKNKELETVTPISSSEENINTPTEDIIPQNPEDVKENFIPDAVREACLKARERYDKKVKETASALDGYIEYIRQIDEFLGRE